MKNLQEASDLENTVRISAQRFEESPFEAGLASFIDMNHADFIGRAALEGYDQRSLLAGVTCQSETPAAGSTLLENNRVVGHVTAGVPSPTLGCGIGYARF
ncbi:MAG: glycine cleavage system aminomethyltransferase T [Granulosicoccus sp.]|jgi:aminomethyltransferase